VIEKVLPKQPVRTAAGSSLHGNTGGSEKGYAIFAVAPIASVRIRVHPWPHLGFARHHRRRSRSHLDSNACRHRCPSGQSARANQEVGKGIAILRSPPPLRSPRPSLGYVNQRKKMTCQIGFVSQSRAPEIGSPNWLCFATGPRPRTGPFEIGFVSKNESPNKRLNPPTRYRFR
jgi:hypothetical protein